MFSALLQGISNVFSWPTILFLFAGSFLGQIFGVLPGLTGSVAMALLISFTFGMTPEQAMALLGGAMGAATFGGSITAILFNTPGTPNNTATCLDGYPLAKQGKAGLALGAGATASAMGALVGLVALMVVIPIMRQIVLAFGPPEFFLLAIFGLTLIAAISEGSFINGLIAGGIGLIITTIGLSPVALDKRFVFGSMYLWDGIKLVPALIGLFAIAEMINLLVRAKTISRSGTLIKGGIFQGIKSVFKNFFLFLRCSVIGTFIGAIPGVGGSVSNFVAYQHAVQTEKNGTFGQGDVRGVIASEASNDAKDGGALIPALSLGIPGCPTAAMILGGLLIHGIFPGKDLMVDNLPLVFTLIVTLAISNIITSTVGLVLGNQLTKITTMPTTILAPIILVLTSVGAFAYRMNMGDVLVAMLFGLFGYIMIKIDFSRIPVVIALVLGPLAEQSFHTSLDISNGSYAIFITRPYSIILILLILLGIAFPFLQTFRKNKTRKKAPVHDQPS
jgi:putative tricarboxylic transport membrane protein